MLDNQTERELTRSEKARRGWWFSVFFMALVVGLILFLTYVEIVEKNRDVLVGILGMTGILKMSGMLRISGMSGQTSSVIPFQNYNLQLI